MMDETEVGTSKWVEWVERDKKFGVWDLKQGDKVWAVVANGDYWDADAEDQPDVWEVVGLEEAKRSAESKRGNVWKKWVHVDTHSWLLLTWGFTAAEVIEISDAYEVNIMQDTFPGPSDSWGSGFHMDTLEEAKLFAEEFVGVDDGINEFPKCFYDMEGPLGGKWQINKTYAQWDLIGKKGTWNEGKTIAYIGMERGLDEHSEWTEKLSCMVMIDPDTTTHNYYSMDTHWYAGNSLSLAIEEVEEFFKANDVIQIVLPKGLLPNIIECLEFAIEEATARGQNDEGDEGDCFRPLLNQLKSAQEWDTEVG